MRYTDPDDPYQNTIVATAAISQGRLAEIFSGRFGNTERWKSLSFMQANVKSKIGCGQPIDVNFFAPVNLLRPSDGLVFDYASLGEDLDLILHDEERYCLKQVYKMCYYIQRLYHVDILRIKCQFQKDETNTIWFTWAKDICVRDNLPLLLEKK